MSFGSLVEKEVAKPFCGLKLGQVGYREGFATSAKLKVALPRVAIE